ncbi:MAG: hypothetical protein CL733_02315 [Chloroflexi bacterium]|nr:hypothetical protein [Chloroflexota bacterium]
MDNQKEWNIWKDADHYKIWKNADEGDLTAQTNLGYLYLNGTESIKKDYEKAAKWNQIAAERGSETAQYNLSVMYREGYWFKQDDEEAAKWAQRSAEQGVVEAQFAVALNYFKGKGVTQDIIEAVKWFHHAAKQGDEDSQNNLSLLYDLGKDEVQAKKWFDLSKEFFFILSVNDFIKQSRTENRKTSNLYPSKFGPYDIKVSFGQGNLAHVPWISFLGLEMTTSNGFFINYLYYKKENLLVLAYGISETNKFEHPWNHEILTSNKKISEIINTKKFKDSLVFKYYKPLIEENTVKYFVEEKTPENFMVDKPVTYSSMQKDLDEMIRQYAKSLSEWSKMGRPGITKNRQAPSDRSIQSPNIQKQLKPNIRTSKVPEIRSKISQKTDLASVIKNGESKTVEFKQTFQLNIKNKNQEKDPIISDQVVKAIAGFLNTEGGCLYIGISDDPRLIGINEELLKFHNNNIDDFNNNMINIFNSRFEKYSLVNGYISIQYCDYDDPVSKSTKIRKYVKIKCRKSSTPIFVTMYKKPSKIFYIRLHGQTISLEGSEMTEYIKSNFE